MGNGTFDMLWGMDQHDCIIENFKIISPPVNEMPKIFGCDRLTFRNGEIRGIRAQSGGHVEGIHINACHDLLFERVTSLPLHPWSLLGAGVPRCMSNHVVAEGHLHRRLDHHPAA